MNRPRGLGATLGLKLIYWLAILFLAAVVFAFFLRHSGIGLWQPESIGLAIAGTAPRPYVYRVLLPLVANLMGPTLGPLASGGMARGWESLVGAQLFLTQLDGAAYPGRVAIMLSLMYASLVGFAVSVWLLLRELGYPRAVRYLHPPVLMVGSLSFFWGFGNFYDLPLLFLFALGLYLMLRRRWPLYILVFGFATLNKETSILLFLVFAAYYFRRLARPSFVRLSIWQLGPFAILQGLVRWAFRGNSGSGVEWHLGDQLARATEILGSPAYTLAWLGAVAVLAFMIYRGWPRKPELMRRALWILPVLVGSAAFLSSPLELRSLLELFPVVGILILPPPLSIAIQDPQAG
jgi:hypothetical protein